VMKKVLFDLLSAQPIGTSKYHGGGEYIKRVFKCLVDEFSENLEITVFYDKDKFLDEWVLEYIEKNKIEIIDVKGIGAVQMALNMNKYNTFYSGMPYGYGKIDFPESMRTIGTFHGLRALEKYTDIYEYKYYTGIKTVKPLVKNVLQGFRYKQIHAWYERSITNFQNIVCVSKHTQYAIMNLFPEFTKTQLQTFYTPAKVSDAISKGKYVEIVQNYGKYILIIGTNRWEKNGYRVIKALDFVLNRDDLNEYKVITVGEIPFNIKKSIRHVERFIMLGYIEPEYLESLYAYCDVFLYPSLNEGFGMPPLEAMKYGKTCVVSGVCSLPELCGDAVYYINPYDIREMGARILHAVYEKKDIDMVINQYKKVYNKQEKDLRNLCNFIIE